MKKVILLFAFLSFGWSAIYSQSSSTTTKTPAQKVHKDTPPKKVSASTSKVKKDGTADRRFKENKNLKKDGTPDKRYKENKTEKK